MHFLQSVSLGAVIVSGVAGCGLVNELPGRSFHQRCGWKAEDYFTDPQVIALCRAIEADWSRQAPTSTRKAKTR
jgi:hypothetical protein